MGWGKCGNDDGETWWVIKCENYEPCQMKLAKILQPKKRVTNALVI